MQIIHQRERDIVLDDEGFLATPDQWDEAVAQEIAHREGIDRLDAEKIRIVTMLRTYYQRHHNFPILANICKKIGSTAKNCVTREFVDPMKAWKIAGLPKPPQIFFTSFDGENYVANPFY